MSFTKNKCNVRECKACCCYNVPMPKWFFNCYHKKIAHPIKRFEVFDDDNVLPITGTTSEDNVCPFLNEHYRCNIYDRRPHICRIFGKGGHPLLQCEFLSGEKPSIEDITRGFLAMRANNPKLFETITGISTNY